MITTMIGMFLNMRFTTNLIIHHCSYSITGKQMDNYFSIYHHRATNMPRDTRSQLIANFLGRKRTKISVKEIIRLFGII